MKIKCGDILFLPHVPETHFAEVGPGKMRERTEILYEIFPLVPEEEEGFFVYGDSCWVPKKAIGEHYSVRTKEDFHHAWISLGFQPIVSENQVRFEKLFDHEHIVDSDCVDSLSSASDTGSSIRSNDSWSTEYNESLDEDLSDFIEDSSTQDHPCAACCTTSDCTVCQERQDTERWFRRDWHPTDPTETAVKSIIERIEEKYT